MTGRPFIKMFAVSAFLFFVTAAAIPARAVILIYGRDSCSNCRSLRQSLDANHISYIFYDVDRDTARNREMWAKIYSITPDSHGIMLPVVDINGKVLINNPTSFEQLKPFMTTAKVKNADIDTSSKGNSQVVYVYGVERCTRCQALRKSLQDHGVSFIFCDFERSKAVNEEMWDKIRKSVSPVPATVNEPIVAIGEKVLLNEPTSYEQIKPYLTEPNAEKKPANTGADSSASPAVIEVYGRDVCGNCQAFMKSLKEHGISFMFFNIDLNSSWNDEMWKKVRTADPSKNNIGLPVVDINGKVFLNNPTSYEQIKPYLTGPKSTDKSVCSTESCSVPYTAYMLDVLAELNLARTDPAGYARIRLAKEGENGTDNGAVSELKHHARMKPLCLNAMLCRAASMYAMYMAEHNVFGHNENGTPFTRIRETGYVFHMAGENIAAGSFAGMDASETPEESAIAFVKQLIIDKGVEGNGHRENILNPNYRELGVGFFHKIGSEFVNYIVQDFGTK